MVPSWWSNWWWQRKQTHIEGQFVLRVRFFVAFIDADNAAVRLWYLAIRRLSRCMKVAAVYTAILAVGRCLTYNGYKWDMAILSNAQDRMKSLSAIESRTGLTGTPETLLQIGATGSPRRWRGEMRSGRRSIYAFRANKTEWGLLWSGYSDGFHTSSMPTYTGALHQYEAETIYLVTVSR